MYHSYKYIITIKENKIVNSIWFASGVTEIIMKLGDYSQFWEYLLNIKFRMVLCSSSSWCFILFHLIYALPCVNTSVIWVMFFIPFLKFSEMVNWFVYLESQVRKKKKVPIFFLVSKILNIMFHSLNWV